VGDGWAEYFSKTAVRLAMATHAGSIEYFKGLALENFIAEAEEIVEILNRRNGDG